METWTAPEKWDDSAPEMEMNNYLTIKCAGFKAYCNALIARKRDYSKYEVCMVSLIGSPSHIKSLTALIFSESSCHVSGEPPNTIDTRLPFDAEIVFHKPQVNRSRKIGDAVIKILTTNSFRKENSMTATVFGPDLSVVQDRAFRRVDGATTIPLKDEWKQWLWENEIYPEKLLSFGGDEFQEAYFITIPCEEDLKTHVLAAIKTGQIQ